MSYSVGKVAALAGVTVRTLHHYDEIGLLSPSERTQAGYRRYSEDDVDRLQRVLFYRELGFSLETIATIVGDPAVDATAHLRRQRELLLDRVERLRAMVAAIDQTLEAHRMGYQLSVEERLEIFGRWEAPASYAEELARRRGTAGFESMEGQWAPRSKEEWQALEDQRRGFAERLHAAMEAGQSPASPGVMDLVEEMRGPMTHEQQVAIAEWYADQPEYFGFIARPGEQLPGMPEWFRDAVRANSARSR